MATEKCPVCNWDLSGDVVEVAVNGRTVRVCCNDCARKVAAEPDAYRPPQAARNQA
jgi:ribosome-binding protein aMBF1 (putative translation factor)